MLIWLNNNTTIAILAVNSPRRIDERQLVKLLVENVFRLLDLSGLNLGQKIYKGAFIQLLLLPA